MKTDTVVFDGKVIDRAYHANYRTTFNPPGDGESTPVVEALPWAVALMKARPGGAVARGTRAAEKHRFPIQRVAAAGDPDARSVHRDAERYARDGHAQRHQLRTQVQQSCSKGSRFRRMCSVPAELTFTLDEEAMRTAARFDLSVVNPAPVDTFFSGECGETERRTWRISSSTTGIDDVNYGGI